MPSSLTRAGVSAVHPTLGDLPAQRRVGARGEQNRQRRRARRQVGKARLAFVLAAEVANVVGDLKRDAQPPRKRIEAWSRLGRAQLRRRDAQNATATRLAFVNLQQRLDRQAQLSTRLDLEIAARVISATVEIASFAKPCASSSSIARVSSRSPLITPPCCPNARSRWPGRAAASSIDHVVVSRLAE